MCVERGEGENQPDLCDAGFQGLGKVDCLHFQSVRPTILKVLVSSAMDHHYDKTFQTVSCIEVEGTATFIDSQNCLKAFVRFGSHKTSSSKLMRRSDAIVGEIYDIRGCVVSVNCSPVH